MSTNFYINGIGGAEKHVGRRRNIGPCRMEFQFAVGRDVINAASSFVDERGKLISSAEMKEMLDECAVWDFTMIGKDFS
jgi:hypothetical protein